MFRVEHFKGELGRNDLEGTGPGFSLYRDDQLVGCGGLYLLWPGVSEAWLLVTDLTYCYPLAFTKAVKNILDSSFLQGMRRVQATVNVLDKRALKFLKFLGFEIEGYMPQFGPKSENHYMMGRLK